VALLEEIEAAPPVLADNQPPAHLPQPLTPFIGREGELTALAALLANPTRRLIGLHGPAGVGKSRLALEAVRRQASQGSHKPLWAALPQPLTAEKLLSVLSALLSIEWDSSSSAAAQENVCQELNRRLPLLVLDGFTPFSEDAALLTAFLARAPQLKLFVTMRERPTWPAAQFYTLNGFTCPPVEQISRSPLAQLFEQQARQILPDYELAEDDWPWLAHLCQRVEGNPAAIVQAATWLRLLPLPEIVRQIEQNPTFLAASREVEQQSQGHF
jgi:predicted ATPase